MYYISHAKNYPMKKALLVLITVISIFSLTAQTTVYTTGQSYADAWTGWSTPVVTNITSQSVNGANIYTFSGMNGAAFTVETYRQFTINSDDIDFYLSATTQNCLVSIEYSTDNVSYTQIGSQMWGAGFAVSTLIIPTYDPSATTFYIKLKMAGTFGSPSQTNFNSLKIDAVLNSSNSVSISPVSTQNINAGVNGTTLTANESPSAATSREWKYSTVSGSGYVSFGTAQTGTTYTPNFAAAGTYYVVCVSNFAGDIITSNEVQINVGTASVGELKLGQSILYANNLLTINGLNGNFEVQIFDLSGKVIYVATNENEIDLNHLNNGLYFVSISMNNERKTLKIVKS